MNRPFQLTAEKIVEFGSVLGSHVWLITINGPRCAEIGDWVVQDSNGFWTILPR